jgi:hypothetical protein
VTVAASAAPGGIAGTGFDRPNKLARRSSKDIGMKAKCTNLQSWNYGKALLFVLDLKGDAEIPV